MSTIDQEANKIIYEKAFKQLQDFLEYYNTKNKLTFEAKLTSIASVVKNLIPDFFFVGFYVVVDELDSQGNKTGNKVLEVGPYQSTILATPRIAIGKGVCGTAWQEAKTQVVNNVKECKNYIACDNETLSEVVIPVFNKTTNEVVAVFDIDSTTLNRFTPFDVEQLEKITALVYQ
ncbi:GAF domain protein, putative (macronuclear) [Tetrahymena thermophila SB210]|uniref:GAF domain protein, putative n=1 Tax=Tetrahymena thermophila (strain SB210) TaxID=312017 RepID=I7MLI6_TETTS|nr:GAF domain protein, putative [Tetrahymena thermophila SB210]EAS02167.1 GAF domain protein, putative [Tetrahymena thermophila SB210]|eukprot:XP_001022412.1 GAF domain protein, putative [Tetrahymena thermophila SB210]